ncbi:MAG: hypothetical protein ACREQY_24325, partial [Candidatus Binatia bacterium]
IEAAPSPLQFDHVVSRARIGKEEVWMDPTSEMTPMGRLPPGIRKLRAVALDARTAKTTIVDTPEPAGWVPTIRAETSATIDAGGVVRAKVRWTYDSDSELLRIAFRYAEDSQRRTFVEAMAYEWDDDAKLGKFTFAEPRDVDAPFWVEYEIEKSMSPSVWRKAWTFWAPAPRLRLNAPPDADDDAKRRAAGKSPLTKLATGNRGRELVSARFELPEGVKVDPPVPVALRRDFADYRSDYRVEGRTLVVERELVTKVEDVPREKFDELRAFREQMKQDRDQEFDVAAAPALVPEGVESGEDLYTACKEALEAKHGAEAERLCRRVTEIDPAHKLAWY